MRVELQEQYICAMAVVVQNIVVGLCAQRAREPLSRTKRPLTKKYCASRNCASTPAGLAGRTGGSPRFDADRKRSGREFVTENRQGAFFRTARLQMPLRAAIVRQHETHMRPRQCEPLEGFLAVCVPVCGLRSKLASRRRIEVKVGHFDDRTGGNAAGSKAPTARRRLLQPSMRLHCRLPGLRG